MVIDAPGYHKLITALYPEGDPYPLKRCRQWGEEISRRRKYST